MANIVCPKCRSNNIDFQVQQETKTITKTKSKYREKRHGFFWWVFIGSWWWMIDLFLWIFLFLPRVLLHIGRKRKYVGGSKTVSKDKVKYRTICVCQNCGYNWKK